MWVVSSLGRSGTAALLVVVVAALVLPQILSAYETNRAAVILSRTLIAQTRDMITHPLLLDPKAGMINESLSRSALERTLGWVRSALTRSQRAGGAWFVQGIAHFTLGDLRAAEHALKSAMPSRRALAGVWLGLVYEAQGQSDKAIEVWRDVGAAGFLEGRSRAFWESGQPAKAIEAYQLAMIVDPSVVQQTRHVLAQYYADLARKFESEGNLDQAINAYWQAIEWHPEYVDYRASLAQLYQRKGWFQQAREQLEIAVARYPDHAVYRLWLGETYQALGQLDKAEEQFQIAATTVHTGNRAWAYADLGQVYLRQQRYADAIAVLEESVRLMPDAIPYRIWLAQAYRSVEKNREAEAQLLEAVKLPHEGWRAWAYAELGQLYEAQGRFTEALTAYEQSVRLIPDYYLYHVYAGAAYQRQARLREALREYEAAVRLNPNDETARQRVDELRKILGD